LWWGNSSASRSTPAFACAPRRLGTWSLNSWCLRRRHWKEWKYNCYNKLYHF
jgi:hypothetical protein